MLSYIYVVLMGYFLVEILGKFRYMFFKVKLKIGGIYDFYIKFREDVWRYLEVKKKRELIFRIVLVVEV